MSESDLNGTARQAALAKAIRAVRRHRRLGVSWMASAMGMKVRSYQHFEAGKGRINVEQVFRFAQVTDCDPMALFIAAIIRAPQLAVRSADNKLVSALVKNLDTFNAELGDAIIDLNATTIQQVFRRALDILTIEALTTLPPPKRRILKRRTPRAPSKAPPKSNTD